jgi:hypothetical protein
MALTEHEQHQLRLLSEHLLKDDPRLAAKLAAGPAPDPPSGRFGAGTLSLLVGLLVFAAGIAARTPALGVLGFALAVAGAYLVSRRFHLRRVSRRTASRQDT